MPTLSESNSSQIYTVTLLTLGWAAIYASRTVLYPLLIPIRQELGLTYAQAGFLATAYFLTYVAMQIPSGFAVDRIGVREILIPAFILGSVTLIALGLLRTDYTLLMALIALHGLGVGAFYPSAYTISTYSIPRSMRGVSSAIINSGMAVGIMIGLAGALPLFAISHDWRLTFLVTGLIMIAVTVLYSFGSLGKINHLDQQSITAAFKNRSIVLASAAQFCSLYGFWAVLTWGPTYLNQTLGVSLEYAGLYSAIFTFSSIPAALFASKLSDKIGRKRPSLVLFPLAAAAIFVASEMKSEFGWIAALIIYGFVGKLVWDPISIAWVGELALESKTPVGSSMSLLNFSGMSSAIVAPVVSGFLIDMTGNFATAFHLGAFIVLLGFFLLLPVRSPTERRKTKSAGSKA